MEEIVSDQTVELLQQGVAGRLDRDQLIGQLSASNPTLGLLAGLLTRGAEGESDAPSAIGQAELDDAARMADDARRLADGIRREFDGLTDEVGRLQRRLDAHAAALGACPGCWGEDPSCRWCRGRGTPGSLTPDAEAFERLVVPVIRVQARAWRLTARSKPEGDRRMA